MLKEKGKVALQTLSAKLSSRRNRIKEVLKWLLKISNQMLLLLLMFV
jgi:hypothetical protein